MNKKLSVIIPTMYRVPYLLDTLKILTQSDFVYEIIIIENDKCPIEKYRHKKIIYIDVYENIYCNPAWNLGVKVSTGDYICLLSDDIQFDFDLVLKPLTTLDHLNKLGIIGLGKNCYSENHNNNNLMIYITPIREFGFGSCMFMNKTHYIEIPDDLKILWGDEFLFKSQKLPNGIIANLQTNKATSLTAGMDILNNTRENDSMLWESKYKKLFQ